MSEQNPYVGARTFETEERDLFFGREREAFDLLSLVVSDRLVLFYAQSGAGKSSLINTRLIPGLRDHGDFRIFTVGRIRRDEVAGDAAKNIYIYNLLTSLSKHKVDESLLKNLTLSGFLKNLDFNEKDGYIYDAKSAGNVFTKDKSESYKYVLIIDQFEELFTTHEDKWDARENFFMQLAAAMREFPRLWIVLVMREDYIAYLDPYVYLLPGRLRTRYYMQRLSTDQAIEAVEGPAKTRQRGYAPGAAETLVEALSQVNVRGPDNQWETRPGQYVEPVQLQVVCSSLWKKLGDEVEISNELVEEHVKNINQALGEFYERRVQEVAGGKKAQEKRVQERDIRTWFETELIIAGKRRNMVAQEPGGKSGGLDDELAQEFVGSLVREEKRAGGATFYELTHDRMVEPIIQNNLEWNRKHSSPFRAQAEEWEKNEKQKPYLIIDQALVDAEQWAEKHPHELTELEREFLETSRNHQTRIDAERERKQRSIISVALVVTLVLLFVAVFSFVRASTAGQRVERALNVANAANTEAVYQSNVALTARAEAEEEQVRAEAEKRKAEVAASQARSGNLAAQADSLKNADYPLALLLGIEAYERDQNLLTQTTLFELLQFTPYEREFGFNGFVSSVAVSPDGSLIAVASCTVKNNQCQLGDISLFDADLNRKGKLPGDYGIVYSLAFREHPEDPLVLAAGGCVPDGCSISRGQITFWNVSDPENPERLSDTSNAPGYAHAGLVKTIAFSPNEDKPILASGSYDTDIILWDVSNLGQPIAAGKPLTDHTSFVNSLAFSHDSDLLVSGSDDTTIRLWNVANPAEASPVRTRLETRHGASVNNIAFSPDYKKFASVSNDGRVFLWDWHGTQRPPLSNVKILTGHTGYVKSVAFSDDGTILASTGFDSRIILWDTSTGEQIGPALSVHSRAVNGLAFGVKSLNGAKLPYLISGSNDRTMIQWDLSARQPLSRTFKVEGETPVETEDQLADSNGEYCAEVNGPQINITLLSDTNGDSCASASNQQTDVTRPEDVFLTLAGFDSPVQYVKFDGPDSILTRDRRQLGTSWMTRWDINSESWLQQACDAVKQSLTEPARLELSKRFLQRLQLPLGEQPQETCISGQN